MYDMKDVVRFAEQRHHAYLWREGLHPPPTDPILRDYRFCNLSRQLDRTTIELMQVYSHIPMKELPFIVLVGRVINSASILVEYLPHLRPYNAEGMLRAMRDRLTRRESIRSNAYMMTTHGSTIAWPVFYANVVFMQAWEWVGRGEDLLSGVKTLGPPTLARAEQVLTSITGVGSFLAGQIIADLKPLLPWMRRTPDYLTYATPGPGSRRGAHRLDLPWHTAVPATQQAVQAMLFAHHATYAVDAQDAQNVLCEFDKYCRVREGSPYRRRYSGHTAEHGNI